MATGRPLRGPWVKADAVGAAVAACSTDWVAVVDSDIFLDLEEALEGLEHSGRRWAMPHWLVYRLDQGTTDRVLTTDPANLRPIDGKPLQFEEHPYPGHIGGGAVVLRREDYARVPMDRRFVGWGHEDDAWGMALCTLLGPPHQGKTPLFHLWHPPQERASRLHGSQESQDLYAQYRALRRTPEALAAFIASQEVLAGPATGGDLPGQ